MAAKSSTARKRASKRRTTAAAGPSTFTRRIARRAGTWAARTHARRRADIGARRDAAILRTTHAGCEKCGGSGVLVKRKKDGSFNGSRPCPAKPAVTRAPRLRVAVEARYGQDKRSGLHGWSCPCRKRARPQWRTPKEATRALREHERRRHGGTSVGGAWYVQVPATPATTPAPKKPALTAA